MNVNTTGVRRSAARLGAVQALYQIEAADGTPSIVIQEFIDIRLGSEIEGEEYADADPDFFADIVRGTHTQLDDIDAKIDGALSGGWATSRLDRTMRQILRAGVYELTARIDVPSRVIITEYVDVAHSFFEGQEPGFVNGVLDRLSRELRPGELKEAGPGKSKSKNKGKGK
jgi:transcription antitermination protein NusB